MSKAFLFCVFFFSIVTKEERKDKDYYLYKAAEPRLVETSGNHSLLPGGSKRPDCNNSDLNQPTFRPHETSK